MTEIVAFRIVQNKFANGRVEIGGVSIPTAFNGAGAFDYGGRWNSKGKSVAYTAGSISLAILELIVHLPFEADLNLYSIYEVYFDSSKVSYLDPSKLPPDWREDPAPISNRDIGDEWLEGQSSLILGVPSTIVPTEINYLINPNHPDLERLGFSEPMAYPLDSRLSRS